MANHPNKVEYFLTKLESWIDEDDYDRLEDLQFLYAFQHETDLDLRESYECELELIIQFQLTIIQLAKNFQRQERKYLFRFLEEKRAELFVMGISIEIPTRGRISERYAKVMVQLQKLPPDQATIFQALRDRFLLQEREREAKEMVAAEIEE